MLIYIYQNSGFVLNFGYKFFNRCICKEWPHRRGQILIYADGSFERRNLRECDDWWIWNEWWRSEACNLHSKMEENSYEPNSTTFTSLFSSCSHSGLIEEGCKIFYMMSTKYKIQPSMEHWTCIIDMLGPAGRLEEAYEIVKSRVCKSDCRILLDCNAVWDTLLNT